jgi:beta-glucosidase
MKRRELLELGLALGGTAMLHRQAFAASAASPAPGAKVAADAKLAAGEFPADFHWGAATSAYQVEGAWNVDGRGESIWDRYAHTPGRVKQGGTGDIACDSYHRYREDIALAKQLGMKSLRYSIAWPRIQPTGRGAANDKGLDFYKRFTDALLEAGIRPYPTLYHWDLPQPLEDAGGWPNRDTAQRLADYAQIVVAALGDRVKEWTILNEPYVFTVLGYGVKVGGAYSVGPTRPASDTAADRGAAERQYKFSNLWFVQPALKGTYPEGVLPAEKQNEMLGFRDGDEKLVRAALDFIGLNYYSFGYVREDARYAVPGLNPEWTPRPAFDKYEQTDFGWDIYPPGMYEIVMDMAKHTGGLPIEITENGAAYNLGVGADGHVHDDKRIAYTRAHLLELSRAIHDGAPVRGYHHWSLLDNFEWSEGFTQRFGLVHIDFEKDQKRTPKDSANWYAKVIASNKVS